MIAQLDGSRARPVVHLTFPFGVVHARTRVPLSEWVKDLPARSWDPHHRRWSVTELGMHPDRDLRDAGFTIVGPDGQECSLLDYVLPLAVPRLGDADGLWEVHPRLGGRELVAARLGPSAIWRASDGIYLVPPTTLVPGGVAVPWAVVDPRVWTASAQIAAAGTLAPTAGSALVFDGTLEGLRGVPIADLNGVTNTEAESMAKLGITNVHDLLHHLPRRHIDLSKPVLVRDAVPGEQSAVLGTITKVTPPSKTGGMLKATIRDDAGTYLFCVWFNAGYLRNRLAVGSRVVVFGKVETFQFTGDRGGQGFKMSNPMVEQVDASSAGKIIGFYPASAKADLSTWTLHRAAVEAVGRLGELADPVPNDLAASHGLPGRSAAYQMVHAPTRIEDVKAGRDRIAYDELLRLQLVLATSRAATLAEPAFQHTDTSLVTAMTAALPFPLTGAQQRAIAQITADMAAPTPMHRLLLGDVGSGKTLVAAAALLTAVPSGSQGALIVPTEILAAQHYGELTSLTSGLTKADGSPVRVALLLGRSVQVSPPLPDLPTERKTSIGTAAAARRAVMAGLADGGVDVVVGTQALLADAVTFHSLGAVVVDEQHRFGAEQRKALRDKGHGNVPDTVYATATPIPRTAVMTIFGDLAVSVLDEMPPGRSPVATAHVEVADLRDRNAAPWAAIRREVEAGRQAFVVTPLVATSEKALDAAAHATALDLQAGALLGLRIGVVTGKDDPAIRSATMASFVAGDLDVLVATTVIEVGVSVPNATVMVILGADRFGLSQLHQLRGRVGRGSAPGSCFLVGAPKSATGLSRIEAMCRTTNGFELAELDLAIRGAGHMTGSAQSGSGRDLVVANVVTDVELVQWAKEDATKIVVGDPKLARRPGLRAEVQAAVGEDGVKWLMSA